MRLYKRPMSIDELPKKLKFSSSERYTKRCQGSKVQAICDALWVTRATVYKWFKNAEKVLEKAAINGDGHDLVRTVVRSSSRNRNRRIGVGF